MYDILSIGDTTIDHIVQLKEADVHCTLDKGSCLLCLQYAEKIPVESWTRAVAGNAANNATGSARLKMKTAIVTIVGDDEEGQLITTTLKKEGVDVHMITKDKIKGTNASNVISFQGERTILVYHEPRKYKLPRLPKSEWVYYTSVGKNHDRYNREITTYIKKSSAKLAYNPGSHQLNTGLNGMKQVLRFCTILFVNKEEAARIIGVKPTIQQSLEGLHVLGPRYVVITDGDNGSYGYDGKNMYTLHVVKAKVVEKTGAGDSFATATIYALHNGKTLVEAMHYGAINSASVIEHIGPQVGLLTKKEIEERYKKSKIKIETSKL